jgi:hypothetical protein
MIEILRGVSIADEGQKVQEILKGLGKTMRVGLGASVYKSSETTLNGYTAWVMDT